MADEENTNLDIEAIQDKQEEIAALEKLSFDPDKFEDLEREFKQFVEEIVGNQNLKKFKEEYTKIYKVLKTSYEGERKVLQRAKTMIDQIMDNHQNVKSAIMMAQNEVDKIAGLKQKVDEENIKVNSRKEDEKQKMARIAELKEKIEELKKQASMQHELEEDRILRQKQDQYDELEKLYEEKLEKLAIYKAQNRELEQNHNTITDEIHRQGQTISELEVKIRDTAAQTEDKKNKKKQLDDDTERLQKEKEADTQNIEDLKRDVTELEQKRVSMQQSLSKEEENLKEEKYQLSVLSEQVRMRRKEQTKAKTDLNRNKSAKEDSEQHLKKLFEESSLAQREMNVNEKLLEKIRRQAHEVEEIKNQRKITKETLQDEYRRQHEQFVETKKKVETLKKEIESKMRERDLLNKDVVEAEEKERLNRDRVLTLENEKTKLKNKESGFKAEARRLNQEIFTLEQEKEKYGIEASQANAKYYQCLEQVKLKKNLIAKFQKKNLDAEAKLKMQQSLYNSVLSDRSLYCNNLQEATEEIADLKQKFRIMANYINQLKEEILQKDQEKQNEDKELSRAMRKNNEQNRQIKQFEQQIKSSENMIKMQDNDIARLKYVISEAESEKQKQKKDYEMVIAERDILGTQLIKRDEELQLLYEKIKIQKSTLKKGEIYYREKIQEIVKLVDKIKTFKRELLDSQEETACIPDLKREVYLLQKELLEQQQKVKFLTDELDKPLNVHRWRKLESTDIETYELIQKIQSLQKRLIAKTEEVSEKDVLIQEKEKLYIELKNILAKQSGPEVTEKLVIYQQNLKERGKQLKEMVVELKNYQSQVHAYKFEIDRINARIQKCKNAYFESRQQQALGMIQEMDEDLYDEAGNMGAMNNMDMNGQMMPQTSDGQQQYADTINAGNLNSNAQTQQNTQQQLISQQQPTDGQGLSPGNTSGGQGATSGQQDQPPINPDDEPF